MTDGGDVDDGITIVKIGGSSITDKAREETLNDDALDWFAGLIADTVDPKFLSPATVEGEEECDDDGRRARRTRGRRRRFVVIHGAGSFGHHSAMRHGLRCGKAAFLEEEGRNNAVVGRPVDDDDDANGGASSGRPTPIDRRRQMEGLSRTRLSVQRLNMAVVDRLIGRGVNAVGLSPGVAFPGLRAHGATTTSCAPSGGSGNDNDDDSMRMLRESINGALRAGLVPVLHGDACLLYDGWRAGILGGDTIAEGLATTWMDNDDVINIGGETTRGTTTDGGRVGGISRVVFITDVAGVFTSDPRSDEDAELIRCIRIDGDTGEMSIVDRDDGDEDDDTRGRSRADGMNVTGSSHAHDVTGGLKVGSFFSDAPPPLPPDVVRRSFRRYIVTQFSRLSNIAFQQAKLGSAVAIVRAGVDVVISQCGAASTERLVRGDWDVIWDVDAGTMLTTK
ncbi:hypothetical protein ACHAW5_000134 [Stephanodiscus triporus]|uniref:Aspartate/glutamate/uridylate kinase domain-containing protein n=1 Tax=Stephanodiscus triporus TaxID=2934178 RepID=A0ABD3MK69_9STRA